LEVIVVDNSGKGLVRRNGNAPGARVIENDRNVGFGAAINQGFRASTAPYLATLNDDAVAHPGWIAALVSALEARPDAGMCASQVRLFGEHRLDSAGMLMAADGSSKQRGQGRPPEDFPVAEEALLPSGSAALYRRAMLEQIGGFDDDFFLYCEDTDLGLRARWAGWKCLYVPGAVVEHHYSHSAGGASPLKAYYVERNRLFVVAKNFPARMAAAAPFVSVARYLWHLRYLLAGRGSAARFRAEGHAGPRMAWFVLRAHLALLSHAGRLRRQRREIRARARITPLVFQHLLRCHAISARRVAEL
jgi:GT2 family glycosyltransferase